MGGGGEEHVPLPSSRTAPDLDPKGTGGGSEEEHAPLLPSRTPHRIWIPRGRATAERSRKVRRWVGAPKKLGASTETEKSRESGSGEEGGRVGGSRGKESGG
jgi:hypothetical protein